MKSIKGEEVYQSIWAMSADATAPAFLRKKIASVEPVAKERIDKLIEELASDQFAVRDAASRELQKLSDRAAGALRKAMDAKPDVEVVLRLKRLLEPLKRGLTAEQLQQARAIWALELMETKEAQETLRVWASGAPGAWLTNEAKMVLDRMERRR
jgi:hypothetical protein